METVTETQESPLTKWDLNSSESGFTRDSVYLYTYDSAGEDDIEEMKELAKEWEGLTRFINEVQPGYAKRER